MCANKTREDDTNPARFIAKITPEAKREAAERLDAIFRKATGWSPRLWGPSILGYGRYQYKYETGREGEFLANGFAPRSHGFSLYILPGYQDFGPLLARLGKYKAGKSCLEIRKLADIDEDVLCELIKDGVAGLSRMWPVEPS